MAGSFLTAPAATENEAAAAATVESSKTAAPPSVTDPILKKAWSKARESGERVEVPDRFTENTKVWAAPDGKSLRAEVHTQPIQLQDRKSRTWKPIDTRIVNRDGKLRAARVKTPLTFGAKDGRTLVSAAGEHGTAGFRTTRALPAPQVSGDRVTYPDAVQPGVDLVVISRPNGFLQQVVLRRRPDGPLSVKLPLSLPDDARFTASATGLPQLRAADGVLIGEPVSVVAEDANAELSPDLGRVGKVGTRVETSGAASSLVLEPDGAFLADPATAYPVTMALSSTYIGAGLPDDTFVSNITYQNSQRTATWLRAGKSANGSEYWETYLKFDLPMDEFQYATIGNADLIVWNYSSGGPNSATCGDPLGSGIVARRILSDWSASTLTWFNRPSTGSDEGHAPGGYNQTGTGWCAHADKLWHSIEPMVRQWVAGTAPNRGLVLRSRNQSEATNWRQYRSNEGATAAYPSSNHAPAIMIEYEPAPTETVISTSAVPLDRLPEYEEAKAAQKYLPMPGESVTLNANVATKIEGQRWNADPIGSDQLNTDIESDVEGEDVPPTVTEVTPEPGAVGVPLDTTVTAAFSEEVTGATVTLTAADGTQIAGTTTSSEWGTSITFTPSAPLAAGTQYTATVSRAQDIWDNTLEDHSWVFTTFSDCPAATDPDTTAPAVRSAIPSAGATGVDAGSAVTVAFCEPVTGAFLVLKDATGASVDGAVTTDGTATTVTFTPAAALAPGTGYTAEISGAADAAGNVMTAASWSFTTGAAPTPTPTVEPDTTPPTVTTVTPENGATVVPVNQQLRVAYSEPVTATGITVTRNGGAAVAGTVAMDGGTAATFTPSAPLAAGATYTATATGATDAAGNVQAAHSWSFSTEAAASAPVNPNPYFETTLDPWYSFYEEDELIRSTARAHQGVASARFSPVPDTWGAAMVDFDADPGDYRLSGWFYPAQTADQGIEFGIEWYDENYEPLSADNFYLDEPVGQWHQLSEQASAPAGTVYALIYVAGTARFFFDEVALVPGAGLTAARAQDSHRRERERGPETLHRPRDETRSKPAKAATTTATTTGPAARAAASAPFNPQHLSLEQCQATGFVHPEAASRIQEKRYTSCFSAIFFMQDFIYDSETKRWKRRVKPTSLVGAAVRAASDLFDGNVGVQFRATYVIHSYLGNADGSGVEGGAGNGLKPQDFKVFTRLQDFGIRDGVNGDTVGNPANINFRLEVVPHGNSGQCTLQSGAPQDKTVAAWRNDPDDVFTFRVSNSGNDQLAWCHLEPKITEVADQDVTLPLWNDWIIYDDGQKGSIARGGWGTASTTTYAPQLRCDWSTLSGKDEEGDGVGARVAAAAADDPSEPHTGACVNPTASPIFIMSKSRDASFLQVIQHIETALKQSRPNQPATNDNRYTVPPLRPGPYPTTGPPPVIGVLGNEQTKIIPGNWDADHSTPAGQPLTHGPAGTGVTNRKVFLRSFTLNNTHYSNYCKYYFADNYLPPLSTILDPNGAVQCDEYPFASTLQGAAKANGAYSIRAVGKKHNTGRGSHGATLTSFYSRERVGPNQNFWVQIVN